jgi:hypothetical protein
LHASRVITASSTAVINHRHRRRFISTFSCVCIRPKVG